jgi:hypothetical protein
MENNNIDKTFNEASKTLEEPATFPGFDKVWIKVEDRLDQKEKKKSKMIPMVLRYGIAASLLIGSGIFYFNTKKENTEIETSAIAKNTIQIQAENNQSVPENIQEIDSLVKANIQSKTVVVPIPKIAYHAPSKMPLELPQASSPIFNEDMEKHDQSKGLEISGKMITDTLKRKSFEEIMVTKGIRKEKTAAINSVELASLDKKIKSNMNLVSDTAEAAYTNVINAFAQKIDEPQIFTYNKANIRNNKPIAANSGFADKIGSKVDMNLINGYTQGININSISGTPGKVDVSISFQGTLSGNTNLLFIINGAVSDEATFTKLDPKRVESIKIFKGKQAIALFGAKATNGAVVVETKDLSRKERRKLRQVFKEGNIKK